MTGPNQREGECDGKCCATTSIAGTIECGRGECDHNGFWSIPCDSCTARAANSWALKCEQEVDGLRSQLTAAIRERDELAAELAWIDAHLLKAHGLEKEKVGRRHLLLLAPWAWLEQARAERDQALASLGEARGFLEEANHYARHTTMCLDRIYSGSRKCTCGVNEWLDRITAHLSRAVGKNEGEGEAIQMPAMPESEHKATVYVNPCPICNGDHRAKDCQHPSA